MFRFFIGLTLCVTLNLSFADVELCGDPPPVSNDSLQGELSGKANILSRFLGRTELEGRIKTTREEIFSKYPNADRVVSDHYLLYQTCVLLMKDNSLTTMEKINALKDMRREFKQAFSEQAIYATCRHSDFGQIGWQRNETIQQSSGWRGGGSNPTNWCNQLISGIVQGRSIGPHHKATVLKKWEQSKKDWKGRVEYNYHCQVKIEWIPLYAERQDARCGTL